MSSRVVELPDSGDGNEDVAELIRAEFQSDFKYDDLRVVGDGGVTLTVITRFGELEHDLQVTPEFLENALNPYAFIASRITREIMEGRYEA